MRSIYRLKKVINPLCIRLGVFSSKLGLAKSNLADLPNDDQIGCIAHISSLIAKGYVTSDEVSEVKINIEAAKRLVEHVRQTDLQSRLTKTLKQIVSTQWCSYTWPNLGLCPGQTCLCPGEILLTNLAHKRQSIEYSHDKD